MLKCLNLPQNAFVCSDISRSNNLNQFMFIIGNARV